MLKKSIIVLMAALAGILVFATNSMAVEKDVEINGKTVTFSYGVDSATNNAINLECQNVDELEGAYVLPESIDSHKIVSLSNYAFKNATGLTSIKLPDSVTEIGSQAFSGCTALTSVEMPGAAKIGDSTFKDCNALTDVTIPKSLKATGTSQAHPFEGCTKLTTVKFEEGITSIPDYLFSNSSLRSVTIPSTVEEIGVGAFKECADLKTVDLGSVKTIGGGSFSDCTALTTIPIPATVEATSGNLGVFFGATSLKKVTLASGLKVIPENLFANSSIEEITIPSTVYAIKENAFANSSLKKLTSLGSNVGQIASNSFDGCEDVVFYVTQDSPLYRYAQATNHDNITTEVVKPEEIKIDISYSSTEKTKGPVKVTITSNVTLNEVEGWTLAEDKLSISKEYTENASETVSFTTEDGRTRQETITIENIDPNATETSTEEKKEETNKDDKTVTVLPQTGSSSIILIVVLGISAIAVVAKMKARKF